MKLSGWTIIIIFACLGASAVFFVLFQIYLPSEQAAEYNKAYLVQLQEQSGKQKAAERRVEKAMATVNLAAKNWNEYVLTRTPAPTLAGGGIDVNVNRYQLVVDAPKFRNKAQAAFNAQLRKGHVKIVSAPEIPKPTDSENDILASYFNYPAWSFPVVLWELGSVTVQGNYKQIMENVRSWSSMPHYLAVVDGLTINGTSPNLTASYNVTIVGFIKASQVYPPPAPGAGIPAGTTPNTPGGTLPGGGAGS